MRWYRRSRSNKIKWSSFRGWRRHAFLLCIDFGSKMPCSNDQMTKDGWALEIREASELLLYNTMLVGLCDNGIYLLDTTRYLLLVSTMILSPELERVGTVCWQPYKAWERRPAEDQSKIRSDSSRFTRPPGHTSYCTMYVQTRNVCTTGSTILLLLATWAGGSGWWWGAHALCYIVSMLFAAAFLIICYYFVFNITKNQLKIKLHFAFIWSDHLQ